MRLARIAVDPWHIFTRPMHHHQRDLQPKRRALIDAFTERFDCASMHFRQLASD